MSRPETSPETSAEAVDRYLQAATRDNTRRSYESAVRHFEVEWGGFLPATADSMARYLADHAGKLALNTLKQRLAALAQWHQEQGFADPTKAPVVRKILKGIRATHSSQETQALPLQIGQLERVSAWLDESIHQCRANGDHGGELRHTRDKALLLLGFWRGFRGDELTRLHVEHLVIEVGVVMQCHLPRSKGDRQLQGRTFKVPALSQLCPVQACTDWLALAGLGSGPVFRSINRWGQLSDTGLHINSLVPLLRRLFVGAGLADGADFTSHSLRRGFAGWANANGWNLKTLMEYVGWKDVKSAIRYIDAIDPFTTIKEPAPSPVLHTVAVPDTPSVRSSRPAVPPTMLRVELSIKLSRFNNQVRGMPKAHKTIEAICLIPHRMLRLDKAGTRYRLTIQDVDEEAIIDTIMLLLDDMHRVADNHQCFLEAAFREVGGDRHWQ